MRTSRVGEPLPVVAGKDRARRTLRGDQQVVQAPGDVVSLCPLLKGVGILGRSGEWASDNGRSIAWRRRCGPHAVRASRPTDGQRHAEKVGDRVVGADRAFLTSGGVGGQEDDQEVAEVAAEVAPSVAGAEGDVDAIGVGQDRGRGWSTGSRRDRR